MRCEHHADREGSLAIDLPSLKIKRYLCAECVMRLTQSNYKGKREAWEFSRIQDEQAPDGRLVYPEMAGLMRNTKDHNRHD